MFGKKNLSKDLSEISAGDSQKKLKTSVREISLAREETSSPPDASNKIKLPFFMIPLKGVQAKVIDNDISSIPDESFIKSKTSHKKGEKKPYRKLIKLDSFDTQRPNLYADYEILRGLKYQNFCDVQDKNNKFYASNAYRKIPPPK